MKISFDCRFVNKTGDDLVPGKIHTIRKNYDFWKKFEGKRLGLFYWSGTPYRSKQFLFAEKTLIKVERICKETDGITPGSPFSIYRHPNYEYFEQLLISKLAKNDGLSEKDFIKWFLTYPDGVMGILHFTDFEYGGNQNEKYRHCP